MQTQIKEHIIDCDEGIEQFGEPRESSDYYSRVAEHLVGIGKVKAELRTDGELYLNDRKVVLVKGPICFNDPSRSFFGERASGVDKGVALNFNVVKYLVEHQELIPAKWKSRFRGKTPTIAFTGSVFINSQKGRWRPFHEGGREPRTESVAVSAISFDEKDGWYGNSIALKTCGKEFPVAVLETQ